MKRRFLLSTLLALLAVVCSTNVKAEGFPLGKSYSNEYFSMDYPLSWSVDDSDEAVFFQGEGKSGANINVTYMTVVEDLDALIETTVGMLKESLSQFQLLDYSNDVVVNNYSAHGMEYTFDMEGIQVQGIQFYINKGYLTYVITLTSTAQSFQKKWPLFQKIIDTFEVK